MSITKIENYYKAVVEKKKGEKAYLWIHVSFYQTNTSSDQVLCAKIRYEIHNQ